VPYHKVPAIRILALFISGLWSVGMCAEDGFSCARIDSGRVGTVVGHLGERAVKQIGKLPH